MSSVSSKNVYWTNEEFLLVVKNSISVSEVLRHFGLSESQKYYRDYFYKTVVDLKVDLSHFKQINHRKGTGAPLKDLLVEHSVVKNNSWIKKRLIKEGFISYVCSNCGLNSWLGQPISLELDHVNGIKDDYRIQNLRLLCPNCHSLTDTFRNKNIKNKTRKCKLPC